MRFMRQRQRPAEQCGSAARIAGAAAIVVLAAVVAGPARAFDSDAAPVVSTPQGVVLQVTQTASQPLALPASDVHSPFAPPAFQTTQQTMLWARRAGWSAGVGVEQRWQPPPGSDAFAPSLHNGSGMLVGLELATSERSSLVWQTPLLRADDGRDDGERPTPQMRVGLNFHSRDPYADLRLGALMRFDLSGQTKFSLRPRHGRLSLVVTSRW